MKRLFLVTMILVLSLSIVAFSAPPGNYNVDDNADSNKAKVYVIHGIPGKDLGLDETLPVDVLVNNSLCLLKGFKFGQIVGPVSLKAGTYNIKISLANTAKPCSNAAVINADVPFNARETATVIAHLTEAGAPTASKYINNFTRLYGYLARVTTRMISAVREDANSNFTLRGGWGLGQTVMIESFGFDEELYQSYALLDVGPDGRETLRPFVGTPRLPNLDWQITVDTPRVKGFSGSVYWLWGKDENFYEWSSANILFLNLEGQWRPTERLRIDGNWQIQSYERRTEGTMVGWRKLPRLKIEYQMTRAIFLRVVSQYDSQFQDDLRDDSRTGLPIVYVNPVDGTYRRALGYERSTLRTDFLFSYQPTPGTVFFAGYGNTLADLSAHDDLGRRRASDGFFLKISYLFRMK